MRTVGILALLAISAPATAATPPAGPGEVRLTLERYEQLLRAARDPDGPLPSWSRGNLRAVLPGPEQAAFVEVTLTAGVRVVGEGAAQVPLLPADVVLERATLAGSPAHLVQRGGVQIAVVAPDRPRMADVQLTYRVPANADAGGGMAALIPLPPLPGASFSVDGSQTGGEEVTVWPGATSGTASSSPNGSLPATSAVLVRWGASAHRRQVRKVEYLLLPDRSEKKGASGDGVEVTAKFDVDLRAARATVRIASASVALMELKEGGTPLSSQVSAGWHQVQLSGPGSKQLTARFRQPIDRSQGQPKIVLALDRAPITTLKVVVPGKRTVELAPALPLIRAEEGTGEELVTTAVAHLPPLDKVTVSWTEKLAKPEDERKVNCQVFQLVSAEEGVINSKVHLRYEILRGKVRELQVGLPKGVVLHKVVGEQIEREGPGDTPGTHVFVLGAERTGAYELVLHLQKRVEQGSELELPIVRPLDVYYQTGAVALFRGKKVKFEDVAALNYTKGGEELLPVDIRKELGGKKVGQAFRHIGEPREVKAKVVAAKAEEVRFNTQVHTLWHVQDTAMLGYVLILVEVESGRADKFVVSLPEALTATWEGSKLVEQPELGVTDGRRRYELRFSQALEGTSELRGEVQRVFDKGEVVDSLAVPHVKIEGAQLESGAFGIVSDQGIRLLPGDIKPPLREVETKDLPRAARRTYEKVRIGCTFSRTPWALDVTIKRHKVIDTVEAVADRVWLETTVYDDGHFKTAATYRIANERLKEMKLEMPEGSEVLKVFKDRGSIRPDIDEKNRITVDLDEHMASSVTVLYEVKSDPLGIVGSIDLEAPRANMRLADIQWLVRTPVELALFGVDTDLKEDDDDYRGPPEGDVGAALGALTRISNPEDYQEQLYRLEERRESQPTMLIELSFMSTPASWTGILLLVFGLGMLAIVTRKRVAQQPMGAGGWIALAVGLGAVVTKAVGWGLTALEASLGVGVLVVVALMTLRMRRQSSSGQGSGA